MARAVAKPWHSALVFGVILLALSRAKKGSTLTTRVPTVRPPANARMNPSTGKPVVAAGIHALSRDELAALIHATGFADETKALALAQRESGGFADVVVDTRGMQPAELLTYWGKAALPELSVGLWQINALVHLARVPGATSLDDAVERLKDPAVNAGVALALSNGGTSWAPWGG